MVKISRHAWIWLACCVASLTLSARANAQSASLVFLNDKAASVTFNDGDSFRVLEGPYASTGARLMGFNTLESHGPVHSWGGWTTKEMFALAKLATGNARRGVWNCKDVCTFGKELSAVVKGLSNKELPKLERCESDSPATDGYGRILWICMDLAIDQIRHGYAHAMTVSEEPAFGPLLKAQHEAIHYRRGMWAKGVPTYIVTSSHSSLAGEGRDRTYNRLVNTVDGHSKNWYHDDKYAECQPVCHEPVELPLPEAYKIVSELRFTPEYRYMIAGIDDILVALSINTYIQNGMVPKIFGKHNDAFLALCKKLAEEGRFSGVQRVKGSCFVNVDFKRRYARPKPACLKW